MGKVDIPYYTVRRNGRGFWEPTRKMRALGFSSVPCGQDGPAAWKIAEEYNARWQRVRRGEDDAPARLLETGNLSPERSEELTVYPRGSLGEAFRLYRRTNAWAKDKKPRTREDWWRGWKYIKPVFGDVNPNTVTLADVDAWRQAVEDMVSLREAHRAVKIWRALWQAAAGLHFCHADLDPSFGFRNRAARGRSATWSEGEAVRLVKRAWRMGYRGLAAGLAVMWDTQLAPGDVRALTAAQLARAAGGRVFFAERGKTGVPVGGALSSRSIAILDAYLAKLGIETLGDAPIIRNRSGDRYLKNAFAEDFREVRAAEFGKLETRKMLDFRRSGAVEAITGDAQPAELAHAMGNSLSSSNALYKTYVPAQPATITKVLEARKTGRRRLRDGNGK